MREIVIQSVDNFYGICLFYHFYLNPVWWSLFSSTGRVCLRPTAFAGPKSRKSDHQTYFNLNLAKINEFHNGRRTRGEKFICPYWWFTGWVWLHLTSFVFLFKGRCAQSVSIKNRYFIICFYWCETDRMIFEGNIICLTFS